MAHALILFTFALLLLCIQISVITMHSGVHIGNTMADATAKATATAYKSRRKCLAKDTEASAIVCGTNGRKIMLFQNECIMEQENHNNANEVAYKAIAIGFCTKRCELMCTSVYEPICAIDNIHKVKRTFNNDCEMTRDICLTNTTWVHYRNGICSGSSITNQSERKSKRSDDHDPNRDRDNHRLRNIRPLTCTKFYNPVCATLYGVKSTFINECSVFAENKKTGKDWQIFSYGVCAEDRALVTRLNSNANRINTNSDNKSAVKNQMKNPNYNEPIKMNYPSRNSDTKTASLSREEHSDAFSIIRELLHEQDKSVHVTYSYTKPQLQIPTQENASDNQYANQENAKFQTSKNSQTVVITNKASPRQTPMHVYNVPSYFHSNNVPQVDISTKQQQEDKRSKITNGKRELNKMSSPFQVMNGHMPSVDAIRGQRATANMQPFTREQHFDERNGRFERTYAVHPTVEHNKASLIMDNQGMPKMHELYETVPNIQQPANGQNNKRVILETFPESNEHAIASKRDPIDLSVEPSYIVTENPNLQLANNPSNYNAKKMYYTIKNAYKQHHTMAYKNTPPKMAQTQKFETTKYYMPFDQQFPKPLPQAYIKQINNLQRPVVDMETKPTENVAEKPRHFSLPHAPPPPQVNQPRITVESPMQLQQPLISYNYPNPIHTSQIPARWEYQSRNVGLADNVGVGTNAGNPLPEHKLKQCPFGSETICAMLGSTTREFNNYCEVIERKKFYKEDWIVLHEGKCPLTCNDVHCSFVYEPICVSWNGLKYTIFNECQYRVARCQDQRSDWKIVNYGECQMDLKRLGELGEYTPTDSTSTSTTPSSIPAIKMPNQYQPTTATENEVEYQPSVVSAPKIAKSKKIPVKSKTKQKPLIKPRINTVAVIVHTTTPNTITTPITTTTTTTEKMLLDPIILPTALAKPVNTTPMSIKERPSIAIESTKTLPIFTIPPRKIKHIDTTERTWQTSITESTNSVISNNPATTSLSMATTNTTNRARVTKRPSIYGPHLSSYIMRLITTSKKKL